MTPLWVQLLAGPFFSGPLKADSKSQVWAAECCGKQMVAAVQPTVCTSCGKQLDSKPITSGELDSKQD
jgi:hypothetical protein